MEDQMQPVGTGPGGNHHNIQKQGGVGGGMEEGGGVRSQYSIPGILHFIQHEWARFEMERSQWEVEKAELQARIAFLQGERKGQENLKNDLVRRIKMLEYALKQERAKYAKLKYGGDGGDIGPPPQDDDGVELPPLDQSDNIIAVTNSNWKQGRALLRQYLQEIGYTDTIIDVRSNRVRSLLGLQQDETENNQNLGGGSETTRRVPDNRRRWEGGKQQQQQQQGGVGNNMAEEMLISAEESVMANFDFLSREEDMEDEDEVMAEDNDDGFSPESMKLKKEGGGVGGDLGSGGDNSEEVLNEFKFLSQADVDVVDKGSEWSERSGGGEWGVVGGRSGSPGSGNEKAGSNSGGGGSSGGPVRGNLELGELEQLTISNDNDLNYDQLTAPKEAFRKTWSVKYTLRSHFDGIRSLGFHPTEPVLITASEDQTLKMWNLQKANPTKKSTALDVEPVYTFRGHTGPVLCLEVSSVGDFCFSGGVDGTVRVWNIPPSSVDPYDSFDASVMYAVLEGHTDAVWDLSYHSGRQQLISCSADGTVSVWSVKDKALHLSLPPLTTEASSSTPNSAAAATAEAAAAAAAPAEGGENASVDAASSATTAAAAAGGDTSSAAPAAPHPTSVCWVVGGEGGGEAVVGYSNAACHIIDAESGQIVRRLQTAQDPVSGQPVGSINKVLSHPTLPLTITAHEDRHIRFYENSTGSLLHSMVAHLDAVTSLAVDQHGLYLISGSHDCSIRVWNLESKTCVQEMTAHRKKFDESILDVAFHPSRPYIASAGADAMAKVYV